MVSGQRSQGLVRICSEIMVVLHVLSGDQDVSHRKAVIKTALRHSC